MTIYAIIFPGQGSQKVGMLSLLATYYSQVVETFAEASVVLGYDLWQLTSHGPRKELNKTYIAQPAVLTASIAIWRILQHIHGKIKPILIAGHSLGEYSALVCSGSLPFTSAIEIVKLRGECMQEAVPAGSGAMSAIIGLDQHTVKICCQQVLQKEIVLPVNFNSPNQTVIAGHRPAVIRANIACKQAGAKLTIMLPITVPSHCILMKPAARKFAEILERVPISAPNIPVINNVDISIASHPIEIRQHLVQQLYTPVRWIDIIKFFISHHVKILFELGPGNILTNFNKSFNNKLFSLAINNPESILTASKILARY